MSTEALAEYRRLEHELFVIRWINAGSESAEEEDLLEEMTEAWFLLSGDEQAALRTEEPKSLIREPDSPTIATEARTGSRSPLDTGLVAPPGTHRLEDAA